MGEIIGSIQKVSGIVGEISTCAADQRQGIDEINSAISKLDQKTQQNSALVEQSTASAESMREQAQELARVVSIFKIGVG
jgi:methyl-accepting chemotaxis protein